MKDLKENATFEPHLNKVNPNIDFSFYEGLFKIIQSPEHKWKECFRNIKEKSQVIRNVFALFLDGISKYCPEPFITEYFYLIVMFMDFLEDKGNYFLDP